MTNVNSKILNLKETILLFNQRKSKLADLDWLTIQLVNMDKRLLPPFDSKLEFKIILDISWSVGEIMHGACMHVGSLVTYLLMNRISTNYNALK